MYFRPRIESQQYLLISQLDWRPHSLLQVHKLEHSLVKGGRLHHAMCKRRRRRGGNGEPDVLRQRPATEPEGRGPEEARTTDGTAALRGLTINESPRISRDQQDITAYLQRRGAVDSGK